MSAVSIILCATERTVQHLPWCTPQTLSLDSAQKNITKFLQGDGSFVLSYSHCRMRNFEGHHFSDVRRAMRGNHLVFMGDSLTRYTYTSLAYFLAHGRWPPSFANKSVIPHGLSVCSEFEFKSWPAFNLFANRQLSRFKEAVPKAEIERHPYVGFEVCDCRRAEKEYSFDLITENRHFRLVPVLPLTKLQRPMGDIADNHGNETLYLLEGDLDSVHDIRVSYISWLGKYKMQFHKAVSSVPRNRQDFEQYVSHVNQLFCSTEEHGTFFPLTEECATYRVAHDHDPPELSDIHISISDPNQPMCPPSAEETLRLQPSCHVLADILPHLNATHLMINSGMWYTVGMYEPTFMDRLLHAARLFLVPASCAGSFPSSTSPSACSPTWQLRPLTWRRTYAPSVYTTQFTDFDNNQEQQIITDLRQQHHDMDVFESNGISRWFANMFHVRHTDGKSSQGGWQDVVLSVDYLRKKNLLDFVRAHPDSHRYGAHDWSHEVQTDKERFEDQYRGIPAQSELGKLIIDEKMTFATDVKPVYEDHLHFTPYVYNEINKVFLSATVPVLSTRRQRRQR